jgi:Ca-activated chloride channel family protein
MTGSPMALMTDEEVAGYGRHADAGFGALATARGLLPLVAMDVEARVAGVIATTEVAQVFVNTTGVAIEATYIFPLPDRAAVHRFRMEVAGRVIDGVIDERGAARASYDQAIAAGIARRSRRGAAGCVPAARRQPDAGRVGHNAAMLVGALPVDDGEVTFRFPLVVAPLHPGHRAGRRSGRARPRPDTDLPDASRIRRLRCRGRPRPIRSRCGRAQTRDARRKVEPARSDVARRDAQVIEVQPGERLDRDFLLRWRIDGDALRSSLVCADDPGGGGGRSR